MTARRCSPGEGATRTSGQLLVTADRDACCQSGRCADALPEVFDNDADGYVVVVRPRVEVGRLDAVEECVDLCPSGALGFRLVEDEQP